MFSSIRRNSPSQLLLLVICAHATFCSAHDPAQTRNNTSDSRGPSEWAPGKVSSRTGEWDRHSSRNVKWVARLGSQTWSSPVVAEGRVYIGTNNGGGHLERYPRNVDLGCLLCFNSADGRLLWQYSAEKLASGRVNDWPMFGIRSTPLVINDRLWFVDNQCRVVCLDTQGFTDGEDDGPVKASPEIAADSREADVVWQFDMMKVLNVYPHNWSTCSPASFGDLLFVTTGNGVDESHIQVPSPDAPSFIAINRRTGSLAWSDSSPGENILHGQWSSPAVGVFDGVPQVIFGGGDGWVYSFRADRWDIAERRPVLLWKFDANPKTSRWIINGRGTRNNILASPVIHGQQVFVAVGQNAEHGDGDGGLWCIDPTRHGDISSELAFRVDGDKQTALPPRRLQAVNTDAGEVATSNPNSGVVWHYTGADANGDGKVDDDEKMHRTTSRPTIANGLLFAPDYYGLVHCLDVQTGRLHWTCDLFACTYAAPLIADSRVYLGDEDGDVAILKLSADGSESTQVDKNIVAPRVEISMDRCIYGDIVAADDVLYVVANTHLFAISQPAKDSDP